MATVNAEYNKIVVIQSLKEFRTGSRLQEDLEMVVLRTDGIVTTELIDVESKKGFLSTLGRIENDVRRGKYIPIIHIEAHGSEDGHGLVLTSGEFISWQEMKTPLVKINKVTRFNLIVCMSACYGGCFVEVLEINDRAPFWALIGPKEKVMAGDLLKDYERFYEELIVTQSGNRALVCVNHGLVGGDERYYFTTAEVFFELVWKKYLQISCTNEALNTRANKILRKVGRKRNGYSPSRNDIKKEIINSHPEKFRQAKEKFFMMDLFEENQKRFLVDYESVNREIY